MILAYPLGAADWLILTIGAIQASPIRDVLLNPTTLITQINILAVVLSIIGTGKQLLEKQSK